jgi:hypothetical protein
LSGASFRDRIKDLSITGRDVLAMTGVEASVAANGASAMIRCPSPDHEDTNPSCNVNFASGKTFCHGCGYRASDVVGLYATITGHTTMGEALSALQGLSNTPHQPLRVAATTRHPNSSGWTPTGKRITVKTWVYTDAVSTPVFQVERIQYRLPDGLWERKPNHTKPYKTFVQAHPGGKPKWLPQSMQHAERPLYQLPRLIAAPLDERVFVVEGESAADALIGAGHLATTSSGGALNPRKTDWSPLAGRIVVIWPDNDPPGFTYAETVSGILQTLNPMADVRVIDAASLALPPGGDAVDWLRRKASHEHA